MKIDPEDTRKLPVGNKADIDAGALDDIAAALRYAELKERTISGDRFYAITRKTLNRIRDAVRSTGRTP